MISGDSLPDGVNLNQFMGNAIEKRSKKKYNVKVFDHMKQSPRLNYRMASNPELHVEHEKSLKEMLRD